MRALACLRGSVGVGRSQAASASTATALLPTNIKGGVATLLRINSQRAMATAAAALKPATATAAATPISKVAVWRVDNPYNGEIVAEVPQLTAEQANEKVAIAEKAFASWRETTLAQRMLLLTNWQSEFAKHGEAIAVSVSQQMGKPLSQARSEVDTTIKRAAAIIGMAAGALQEEIVAVDPTSSLLRKITKEPIGVVLALVPWNYPLLCAVNTVVSATLAGCPVLLKLSDRTPLVADAFEQTFLAAGAPKGLVQALHVDHELTQQVIRNPAIAYVHFTGSVSGGRAVYKATAESRFIDVGLELGGKDPAYIASDADLEYAIANVVDGGMYNAGQSCCAVERVYVHQKHYDAFLHGATKLIKEYHLGDPMQDSTTMGPIAQKAHPKFLLDQVEEAVKMGARLHTGGKPTTDAAGKGRFFQPTLLSECTPTMRVIREESFGPLLAVTRVKDDAEAIRLMNDSDYGLTASIWSSDVERSTNIANQLQTGTVFMNRSDFLDPHLAWSGRKDSGKGIGLSKHGFAPFIRTKSWNFRPNTK